MVAAQALESGRAAFESHAWRDAYELLSDADAGSPLAPADLDRLAVAAYLIGRDAQGARVWERAYHGFVAGGEVARAVRCGLWLGLILLQAGEHARGGGWVARAQRLLDESGLDCVEAGYLRLPVALQRLHGRDPDAALAVFTDVAEVADRFADPDLMALSRLGCGQSLVATGQVTQGVSLLDEAMVAVTAGELSPIVAGIIYCAVLITCRDVFDLRRAHEWTAALSRWCDEQQDIYPYRGQCLVHRSELLQLRGQWADAMAEARQAHTHLLHRAGDPVLGMALYQQAELLRVQGEFDRAEQAYREAGDRGHTVQPGLALLRLAQGRTGDSEASIRRAVDDVDDRVARSRVLAAFVEIMLAAGRTTDARAAADDLTAAAGEQDSPYLRAVAGYADGAVLLAEGDPIGAAGVLRRAWRAWTQLEAPYEAARTRRLIGRAYALSGDHDGARVEWAGASEVFARLGAAPDSAAPDSAAPDSAASDRVASPAAAGRLTAREVEVLRLVAAGRSNREIASTLVLSEHTVRRHLQNIFAKLDVASRAAATAYAYQHGLV
jgi:DNA-binding CsgD family transcriptional regulator